MEIATTNQVRDFQDVATCTGKQVRKRPSLSNLDSNVLQLEEIAHHHNHEKQTSLQPTQTLILPFRSHNLGVEEINHFVQIIDPMSRINFMGGLSFTRRQLGIACSVFNGVWVSPYSNEKDFRQKIRLRLLSSLGGIYHGANGKQLVIRSHNI